MTELFNVLVKGGITMIPLALCSLLGLAVVLQKVFDLRRKKVLVPEIISVINKINGPDDVAMAKKICDEKKGPFAHIVKVALNNLRMNKSEIKELITDEGRQQVRDLERGLVILETVAGIAPLLGLFGTVLGMIKVFDTISKIGVGQASALSGGISEALITTAVGLSIGIPALVFFNYFTSRAENLILDIEKYSTTLLQKIHVFYQGNMEGENAI
jgi:biopolymer transport protein ExbB